MFSVVIPLYNKEYSIERCLSSVVTQTFSEFQIVIVNDGSEDNSLEVVEKFINNHRGYDITLINKKNRGVSHARNVGVKKSKHELICFLDADDCWDPIYLEKMLELILKKPEASLYICGYKRFINNKLDHKYFVPRCSFEYINFFSQSAKYPISVTCSTIILKDTFNKLGGFPLGKAIGEDLYLWARVAEHHKVAYLGMPLVSIYFNIDHSRERRLGGVPYILEYYSKNKTKNKELIQFLKYIYIAHLYQSYSKKSFSEFKNRFEIGFNLFPFFSIYSLPILLVPIQLLKNIRNKKG